MSFLRTNKKTLYKIFGILISSAILIWVVVFITPSNDQVLVTFYDVGQGDAILVKNGTNQILIDGGPDNTVLYKLGQDMPFYDHDIELVILTHPDADHVTGLVEVLKRYNIRQILCTDAKHSSSIYSEWKQAIQDKDIPVKIARAGQIIYFDKMKIYILYPENNFSNQEIKNLNSTSVVSRLIFGKNSILFTGDIENDIENVLINRGLNLKSDVLKVAHHGSKTSSTQKFVQLVDPRYAVISVGTLNKYGHPAESVLENLQGRIVLRTDLNGDIKCKTNGIQMICK